MLYSNALVIARAESLCGTRASLCRWAPERAHIVPRAEEYHHRSNAGVFEESFIPGESWDGRVDDGLTFAAPKL